LDRDLPEWGFVFDAAFCALIKKSRGEKGDLSEKMNLQIRIAQKINQHLFYGWVMLAVGFLGMLATGPGQSFNIAIFVNPLIEELNLSRTAISSAYSLGTLIAAFGLSYVGWLIDRFGPRLMIAAITLSLGLVCMLFPLVSGIIALSIAFTAVRFFGQGSLTLGSTNLVSQWFSRRRGMALSITSLGFAMGNALYPPLIQMLITRIGWRMSWVWLGAFVIVLIIPIACILVVNKPEDMGLLPDGDQQGSTGESNGASETDGVEQGFTLGEALHTVTFWVLAVAIAIPSMLVTGMIFHQISYFEGQGLGAQSAANIFPVLAVSMVFFMVIYGQLLDRFKTSTVVSAGILTMAVTMWLMRIADTTFLAGVYGVSLGATSAATMTNTSYVWPRFFGRKHLSGIQGTAYTVCIIGAAIGPLPFGIAYDVLGGYHETLLWLSVLPVVFGLAVFFTHPPARDAG
jgi:sugar phosphate permease